jgi:hypothetical protein
LVCRRRLKCAASRFAQVPGRFRGLQASKGSVAISPLALTVGWPPLLGQVALGLIRPILFDERLQRL